MTDSTDVQVLQAAAGLYRNHAAGINRHTASGVVSDSDIRYFNDQADRLESIAASLEGVPVLPLKLDRDQAAPLCKLEGSCDRSGECYADCDSNGKVRDAWNELRPLLHLEGVRVSVCDWSPMGIDDGMGENAWWQSGCGHDFVFNEDGPSQNGFGYCPFCGDTVHEHDPNAEQPDPLASKCHDTAREAAPRQAHSKSEYKRLKAQGVDVLPPKKKPK